MRKPSTKMHGSNCKCHSNIPKRIVAVQEGKRIHIDDPYHLFDGLLKEGRRLSDPEYKKLSAIRLRFESGQKLKLEEFEALAKFYLECIYHLDPSKPDGLIHNTFLYAVKLFVILNKYDLALQIYDYYKKQASQVSILGTHKISYELFDVFCAIALAKHNRLFEASKLINDVLDVDLLWPKKSNRTARLVQLKQIFKDHKLDLNIVLQGAKS